MIFCIYVCILVTETLSISSKDAPKKQSVDTEEHLPTTEDVEL